MRNSFVSWLTAAVMVCGFSIAGLNTANAESVMRTCASEWKQAQAGGTTGGQAWPQFLAQCRTRQGAATAPTAAPAPPPQSGSLFPWSQPSTPTSTAASNVGAPATGQSVMRLCASQWKDAKAAGTTAGQTWPQFLSQCRARQTSTASSSGGFVPAPGPGARFSVRISVPVVATIGALDRAHTERRHALDPAGGPIHNGARGACSLPVGHRRVGQHADAHLPLFGNPLLRPHPQGRIYVRG